MSVVAETTNFPGSSNLTAATYDPDREQLTIDFRSGRSYVYYGVEPDVYLGLQRAGADAGNYFIRHIRSGAYDYDEV